MSGSPFVKLLHLRRLGRRVYLKEHYDLGEIWKKFLRRIPSFISSTIGGNTLTCTTQGWRLKVPFGRKVSPAQARKEKGKKLLVGGTPGLAGAVF